jgi:ATP-dependent RNA helicase DeaD
MEHIYYEVGTSLLAKPQALCDLVEYEAGSTCVVFCNSPSDADFADVILKKRGISSLKLIGYVPQIKLSKAVQQLESGEITALVLTDVAARGIPLEQFDVVINYSIPTDPEVYFHRFVAEGETKTKRIVSLVAAMDVTNFHYLKKLEKVEFVQSEPPTAEQLHASKFNQLRDQAVTRLEAGESDYAELIETLLADEKSKEIIALLLDNTMSVIPALKAAATPAREERDEYEDDFEDDDVQPDFDRRDRRGRDNRRGRGNNGNRGDRRSRSRNDSYDDYDDDDGGQAAFLGTDEDEGRGGRRQRRSKTNDRNGEGRRRQREPRKPVVIDKEARLYVGLGSNEGVTAEDLSKQVTEACGLEEGAVHKVSIRGAYSYVDVAEDIADSVVEKLGEASVAGKDEKFFVKRAITLSIPRDPTPEELAAMTPSAEDSQDDSVTEGRDEVTDHGEEDGPTLLAVDEQA